MLLARQTVARATFFTAANFTLREGRQKVNEGSYLLACRKRWPQFLNGPYLKLPRGCTPQKDLQ
jgi:hypothetical protein